MYWEQNWFCMNFNCHLQGGEIVAVKNVYYRGL